MFETPPKQYQVAKFAHQFRMHLFREHLGLLPRGPDAPVPELDPDPLSPGFQRLWQDTASQNTLIYRDVFRCVRQPRVSPLADSVSLVGGTRFVGAR